MPGLERLAQDIDKQKPESQAKINTLFKPGKDMGTSPSTPVKRPAASRLTKKAQQEQQAELAEHAQQAQHAQQTGSAQQTGEEEDVEQPHAAATPGRALEGEAATAAAHAAKPRVLPSGNGSLDGQTALSARAARLHSRLNQQHTIELASPGDARAGKRRRASMVSHARCHRHAHLACWGNGQHLLKER